MTQTELELLGAIDGKMEAKLNSEELAAYLLGQYAGLAYAVVGPRYSQHTIQVNLGKVDQAIQKLKGKDT